jgi:PAS domain
LFYNRVTFVLVSSPSRQAVTGKTTWRHQVRNHSHPEVEAAEYVVFADSSRRYVDCSDGISRLLGYSRAEMLEKTVDDVSLHNKEVAKLFGLYLRQGGMEGEYVLRDKAGMPVPIRYRAFVFPDGCNAAVWEPIQDWRGLYLAALVEFDPAKLRNRIDLALASVHQHMRELERAPQSDRNGQEQTLRDALSALQALQRNAK